MTIKQPIVAGLLVALVSGGASAQDEDTDSVEKEERVCVNVRSIRTFDAFTDRYVYVREGSDEHYLFTMRGICMNLRDAHGIAIKDASSRICSDGFGDIVYRDRLGGRRLQSCPIGKIERVESKEDAKAIVEEREKEKQ